jgi:hypothetical protein
MPNSIFKQTHVESDLRVGGNWNRSAWVIRTWSAKGTGRNAASQHDRLDFKTIGSVTGRRQCSLRLCVGSLGHRSASTTRADLIRALGQESRRLRSVV